MTNETQNTDEIELPVGCTLIRSMGEEDRVMLPHGELVPLRDFETARTYPAEAGDDRLPVLWMDREPAALTIALERRKENRQILLDWIKEALVEDTDFGRIHFVKKESCPDGPRCTNPYHWSKPSLWKAGAEKIAGMLGFRPHWPELADELAHVKAGATVIGLRCQLLDQHGCVVSEGIGARGLAEDYQDVNKALKMAKKSGLIDAVLNAGGLSEVFTQDLSDEDDPRGERAGPLNDDGQAYLLRVAADHFGDVAEDVLRSLAKHRFRISTGNWREIPAYRMQDAIHSLEEKAEEGLEENVASYTEGDSEDEHS